MYIKDLIKELKKYPDDYCVRVRIDDSFWKQEGFGVYKKNEKEHTYTLWGGVKYKGMKIPKKIRDSVEHNLCIPNYWVEHIKDSSYSPTLKNSGREVTLWGEY